MWIGAFSAASGLTVGTIRFYVRAGLLRPEMGTAGGTRPYLVFSKKDLRLVAAIRTGQALGMSLAEIGSLVEDGRSSGTQKRKMLQVLTLHRGKLGQRAAQLESLICFVDAKIAWLRSDRAGPMPEPPIIESSPDFAEPSLDVSEANRRASSKVSTPKHRAPRRAAG